MATSNDLGSDDFDRFAREAGDGLRRLLRQALENPRTTVSWADIAASATRPRPAAEPVKEPDVIDVDPGVWAIVREDNGIRVERVFPSELEALRANQGNTDQTRSVRFLEYGSEISG